MRELTYIIGAGASYESMPLVKNFPRRFRFFVEIMNQLSNHPYVSAEDKASVRILHQHSLAFYKEIVSHQSFDTFFKKLYHTEQQSKINLYKKVLNVYFLWESVTTEKGNSDDHANISAQEGDFIKRSLIDKRYDALIAGLLKPEKGTPTPYCKVNFITWNYDLNLILSIKNYYSPNSTIGDFIKSIDNKNNVWNIGDHFSIVNMNGYFYNAKLDPMIRYQDITLNEMIFEVIKDNYFEDMLIDKDANLISFAWESEGTNSNLLKQIIADSGNIVVIGYTFPLYNRLVDLIFLNDVIVNVNRRIYIQDPNSDQILDSVKTDFGLGNSMHHSKSIKECDSFFIPSNIFKETIFNSSAN